MKLIVAGSRNIVDVSLIFSTLDELEYEVSEVVCGGARGPDTLGKRWAMSEGIPVKMFIPDWDGLGKRAGILRNIEMGDYADCLVAFWDTKSVGTKQMIEYMQKLDKPVHVITVL